MTEKPINRLICSLRPNLDARLDETICEDLLWNMRDEIRHPFDGAIGVYNILVGELGYDYEYETARRFFKI
jgi:hypothetical protein